MDGRVVAIDRSRGLIAIETELHGFTIVELLSDADVETGDPLHWDSDLDKGTQTYMNGNTGRRLDVIVRQHLLGREAVREHSNRRLSRLREAHRSAGLTGLVVMAGIDPATSAL